MKIQMMIVSAMMLALSIVVSAQAQTSTFDGTWNVQLKCEQTFNAPAYTYKFVAEVKDSQLLGQYGSKDKPNSLKISGKIEVDGRSMLQATGYVGKAGPKGAVEGQVYNYVIKAQFNGSQGNGTRMQTIKSGQRNCDYVFTKQ